MPETNLDILQTLRQKVYSDPALQARLFECVDTYGFWQALREIALEIGLDLDEDTVRTALHQGGRGRRQRLVR